MAIQPYSPYVNTRMPVLGAMPVRSALALRDTHFPLLARGINLAGWTDGNAIQPTLEANQGYIGEQDLMMIRDLGFTHVRIPMAVTHFLELASPTKLNESAYQIFATMVQKSLAQGLGVVVDMHPDDPDTKRKLATDARFVEDFATLWSSLASRLSRIDHHRIFFEPLNEPSFQNFVANPEKRWNEVQNKLVQAIRANAPNNTIIVTSFNWDSKEGLSKLSGLDDANVVHSFHYYTPVAFTHQGSTWSGPGYARLHHMPYPNGNRNEQIDRVSVLLPEDSKKLAQEYKANPFNAQNMANDFSSVINWAKQNSAKLYLGEFGVLKKQVNPTDRAQWIADMRQLCERNNIGWGMWEYDQEFGLANNINGKRTVDPLLTKALGLNDALALSSMVDPAKVLFRQRHLVNAVSSSSQRPESLLRSAS